MWKFATRASIGQLRIVCCSARCPARTVKQWVLLKCSTSRSHSDFCFVLFVAVCQRWCSLGDFMHTAVVESSEFSWMDPTISDKRIDFFFISSMNSLISWPLSWVLLPKLSACLLFSKFFQWRKVDHCKSCVYSGGKWILLKAHSIIDVRGHNHCMFLRFLQLRNQHLVYVIPVRLKSFLFYSFLFLFFSKTWSNALELIEMFPSLPHLYGTARKHAWHEVISSRKTGNGTALYLSLAIWLHPAAWRDGTGSEARWLGFCCRGIKASDDWFDGWWDTVIVESKSSSTLL